MADSLTEDMLDFPELIDWESEASAIIRDVQNHVIEICVSKAIASSRTQIFLNITTLESNRFCVRVSGEGFRVVGHDHDQQKNEEQLDTDTFDTPYALLNHISAAYANSFAGCLSEKLQRLAES